MLARSGHCDTTGDMENRDERAVWCAVFAAAWLGPCPTVHSGVASDDERATHAVNQASRATAALRKWYADGAIAFPPPKPCHHTATADERRAQDFELEPCRRCGMYYVR